MKRILSLLIALCSTAHAQLKYTLTIIAEGGNGHINRHGDIVGTLTNGHPFLYRNGKITDIGLLIGDFISSEGTGAAVNDSDEVVGSANGNAFIYNNGNLRFITHSKTGESAAAASINNQGEVVGYYDFSDSPFPLGRGFLYRNGRLIDLGGLSGKYVAPIAINNLGQITGVAETASGNFQAFLYQNGRMQAIAQTSTNFTPTSINDHGQIAGFLNFQKGHQEAAVWQNGVVYPLGYLPGSNTSAAFSINNSGEIVGLSDGIPFVRKRGVLETLLVVSPPGWGSLYNIDLEQINDSGQIVALAPGENNLQRILLLQPLKAEPSFHIGESVMGIPFPGEVPATTHINIRSTPAGALIGTQPNGVVGVIKAGPASAPANPAILNDVTTPWWNVTFPSGVSGWVGQIVLGIEYKGGKDVRFEQ